MTFLARVAEDSPGRNYLLTETTVADYQRGMAAAAEQVSDVLAAAGPTTGVGPHRLERAIADIDLDEPLHDPAVALDELEHVYLRDAVYFHHPRYLGHLNCPVVIPAVLAEATLSAINSSMDTWDQSAGATLIEQPLIEWTARRIGLGPAADGVFTSGGTQSNLQAMLLAREEAWRRTAAVRRSEITPRLRILTSECGHFSVVKAAKLLGLDADAVIRVPCDERYRLRPDALAAQLRRCAEERLIPMAVVATAGTTDFGSIDPLPQIADLCARAKTWLHVDAAYGCGLLVSARHRDLLAGIERADSVTVDFHKSFFQPVSSSAVLVRDRATLRHATYHADYLNPADDDSAPNLVDKSLQTTRRFDALKLWLTLRVMGAEEIGRLFDDLLELARQAFEIVDRDPRFEVAAAPVLSTLVFRYLPAGGDGEQSDRANRHARKALYASGEAVVAGTVVAGRQHMKFTLLNPRTTPADISAVLDLLAGHAERYVAEEDERRAS